MIFPTTYTTITMIFNGTEHDFAINMKSFHGKLMPIKNWGLKQGLNGV